MRRAKQMATALAVAGLIVPLWAGSAGVANAQSWPGKGYSYYVATTDTQTMYDKGLALGNMFDDGRQPTYMLSALIFGQAQRNSNGAYGASAYGGSGGFASTTEIKNAVYEFARGWAVGIYPASETIQIAVATTNNYNYPNMTHAQVEEHATAWANMIDAIDNKINVNGFGHLAYVAGGNDIEMSWGGYSRSTDWVDAYNAATI